MDDTYPPAPVMIETCERTKEVLVKLGSWQGRYKWGDYGLARSASRSPGIMVDDVVEMDRWIDG